MRNDEELNKFLNGITIAQGGVIPHIHDVLLPSKKGKKAAKGGKAKGGKSKGKAKGGKRKSKGTKAPRKTAKKTAA